ncbi:MAG: DUF5615 family PIN-like protein, partial [Pseudomonadales bacterium]
DNNLSHRLASKFSKLVEECQHVRNVGLESSEDMKVWQFAKDNGYVIVTKDEDFSFISHVRGYPPKVVWLKVGNCSTTEIEKIIGNNINEISVALDSDVGIIEIEKLA